MDNQLGGVPSPAGAQNSEQQQHIGDSASAVSNSGGHVNGAATPGPSASMVAAAAPLANTVGLPLGAGGAPLSLEAFQAALVAQQQQQQQQSAASPIVPAVSSAPTPAPAPAPTATTAPAPLDPATLMHAMQLQTQQQQQQQQQQQNQFLAAMSQASAQPPAAAPPVPAVAAVPPPAAPAPAPATQSETGDLVLLLPQFENNLLQAARDGDKARVDSYANLIHVTYSQIAGKPATMMTSAPPPVPAPAPATTTTAGGGDSVMKSRAERFSSSNNNNDDDDRRRRRDDSSRSYEGGSGRRGRSPPRRASPPYRRRSVSPVNRRRKRSRTPDAIYVRGHAFPNPPTPEAGLRWLRDKLQLSAVWDNKFMRYTVHDYSTLIGSKQDAINSLTKTTKDWMRR